MSAFIGYPGDAFAAKAVAAVTAWRDRGSQIRSTPFSPAGAALESYMLATTPVLTAGIYALFPLLVLTGSASGTDLEAVLAVDGVPFPALLTEAAVPGGGFLFYGAPDLDFSAGDSTHTFEFSIAQPAGPGTVTALAGSLVWERVG